MNDELKKIIEEGTKLRQEIEKEFEKEDWIRLPGFRDKVPDRSSETTMKMLRLFNLRDQYVQFKKPHKMNNPEQMDLI